MYINDFIALIYPEFCYACNATLVKGEKIICTKCKISLPHTNYHLDSENPVKRKFYGKVQVRDAFSMLNFVKQGGVQKLMHNLKYNGVQEIGEILGRWYGKILKDDKRAGFDIIIPVPLHKIKLKKRGYNQVDSFGRGLSETTAIPFFSDVILKKEYNESQTKKKRYERWENTNKIYEITNPSIIENKSVLIIDDVITTGSTLEACAAECLQTGCKDVSIATIATAI